MYVTSSGDVGQESKSYVGADGQVVSGANRSRAPYPLNYIPGMSYLMSFFDVAYIFLVSFVDFNWEERQKSTPRSGYGSNGSGGFGGGGGGGGRPSSDNRPKRKNIGTFFCWYPRPLFTGNTFIPQPESTQQTMLTDPLFPCRTQDLSTTSRKELQVDVQVALVVEREKKRRSETVEIALQ